MQQRRLMRAAFFLAAAALVPACGGGGGGGGGPSALIVVFESESNNTFDTANPLAVGVPVSASLAAAGDVDFYALPLAAGQIVRIQCFAHRLDQATWNAGPNSADVALLDTNGTTVLIADGDFNPGDPDIAAWRILASGTYFVRVRQETPANTGGSYVLLVSNLPAATQFEAELVGDTSNDSFFGAEALTGSAGRVAGHLGASPTVDIYSLAVTAPALLSVRMFAHVSGLQSGTVSYDSSIDVLATDGTTVLATFDDGAAMRDSLVNYVFMASGTYFIKISRFNVSLAGFYIFDWALTGVPGLETEDNDTFGTANPIAYDTIVNASAISSDADFFSFTGTAGDQVLLEIWEGTNPSTAGATYQGSTGAVAGLILGTNGTTPIQQSTFSPNATVLHRTITAILQSTGIQFIQFVTPSASATGYAFRLTRVRASTLETEVNDAFGTADALAGPTAGVVGAAADADFFTLAAAENELVVVRVMTMAPPDSVSPAFDNWGSTLNSLITVLGTDGTTPITSVDRSLAVRAQGTVNFHMGIELAFVAPSAGTFFLKVTDVGGLGDANRYYILVRE